MSDLTPAGANGLSLMFAVLAADTGWSQAAFQQFLRDREIDDDTARQHWPRGVRNVSWHLNAAADEEMVAKWRPKDAPMLSAIVTQRFTDNRSLKRSVARLALSDAVHPFDTLARTAVTADKMLRCRGGYHARTAIGRWVERWALVCAYSASVLVWLGDSTGDERHTVACVRFFLKVIGAS